MWNDHVSGIRGCIPHFDLSLGLLAKADGHAFAAIEPHDVATRMKSARVVDSRNILDKTAWRDAGFVHRGVGR